MAKKTKAPNPLDTHERFKGPPSDTNMAHVPTADQENPYTLGQKLQELNAIQHPETPRNSTRELPPPPPDPGSPPCNAPPHPDKPQD
ncbi:hypothetical protein C0989_005305 [Termitomyces sp. Mn162]|nr:hypothetical protein C0989_005305 [Termitomyces sp. Mn162]